MRYLLVDAHSVIFAWPELLALHQRRNALARDELVRRLTLYQDASSYRVVAVFDGKGVSAAAHSEPGGIQIFYSSSKQTADSIIERLVAKYAPHHDLTVVTNDHLEQLTVSSFGAIAVPVETLLGWMDESDRLVSKQLRSQRRKNSLPGPGIRWDSAGGKSPGPR